MLKKVCRSVFLVFYKIAAPFFLVVAFPWALYIRWTSQTDVVKPRLVWGATPIINNSYWSLAMRDAGYETETFTTQYYTAINARDNWDRLLDEEYPYLPYPFRICAAFLVSLKRYDVFFIPFHGYFLGNTPLWRFEYHLLKLARKKIVVLSYGADFFVYRRIRSIPLIHGLLMSYPDASKRQGIIARHVDYWSTYADAVIPGWLGTDGLGRWDVLTPSALCLDLKQWTPSVRKSHADGGNETVYIAHAPNHRGFKGTEFVVDTIQRLKGEGLKVELILLEKKQNHEVREILREKVDILIEQVINTGHGLNGLEGLASGLPTISNLEDEDYTVYMRRWSFFSECPLVSACPENLADVLRKLITRPGLRHQLGDAGYKYVEKYHGYDSAQYLFSNIIDYIYGRKESIINMYHPLLGDYKKDQPKIAHPLVNNKIVD